MRFYALCFALLTAIACSDDKQDDDPVYEGVEVGAAGGQVVADDGALTMDIPPGALADNVRISITSSHDGRYVGFADTPRIVTYEFAPAGLTFALPVAVTTVLPNVAVNAGENTRVPMILAMLDGNGAADINVRQELVVDIGSGSATHTTELSHFSGMSYFDLSDNLQFILEPTLPSELVNDGSQYGVGVRVKSNLWAGSAFSVLYNDDTTGAIGYSGGSVPFVLANFIGSDFDQLVPAGTYQCLGVNKPSFSVTLSTPEGGVQFGAPGPLLEYPGGNDSNGNASDLAPTWPFLGPELDISVTFKKELDCVAPGTVDSVLGPPYSGIVQYGLPMVYPGLLLPSLAASFSEGGAEQSAFDNAVTNIQRLYGIRPDRGTIGQCYPVQQFTYEDEGENPTSTPLDPAYWLPTSHVGTGANDKVVAKTPADVVAEVNPFFLHYTSLYEEALPFPASGIPVYAPADAPSPLITLPSITTPASAITIEGFGDNEYLPLEGIEISWQADTIDADFMHVLLVVGSFEAGKMFECFVQPSTQVLSVPSTVVDTMLEGWDNSYEVTFEAYVLMVKRTEVAHDGRALIGFTVRQVTAFGCEGGEGGC